MPKVMSKVKGHVKGQRSDQRSGSKIMVKGQWSKVNGQRSEGKGHRSKSKGQDHLHSTETPFPFTGPLLAHYGTPAPPNIWNASHQLTRDSTMSMLSVQPTCVPL